VYERVLRRCRECILESNYVVTLHAVDELEADGYSLHDLESGILTGSIVEIQRDRWTRERKYRIRGDTRLGRGIELVVKLGTTGGMVIITVYEP
jgi:hypothetical protein